MDKKKKKIITVVFLGAYIISAILFVPSFLENYSKLPQGYKNLVFAIGTSGTGIFLHFVKEIKRFTPENKETANLLELLMLMVTPMFASFEILGDVFKQNPVLIPIFLAIVSGIWFGIALEVIYRKFKEKGKEVLLTVTYLYGMLTSFAIANVVFILSFVKY